MAINLEAPYSANGPDAQEGTCPASSALEAGVNTPEWYISHSSGNRAQDIAGQIGISGEADDEGLEDDGSCRGCLADLGRYWVRRKRRDHHKRHPGDHRSADHRHGR